MLHHFSFLENLTPEQIYTVEQCCQAREYAPDEYLFQEGDLSRDLYFLHAGTVALYKHEPTTGDAIKTRQIHAGQGFGELRF